MVVYPQAIYYGLRSFFLERRDGSPGDCAAVFSEELLTTLRRHHHSLYHSLEHIVNQITHSLKALPEQELAMLVANLYEGVVTLRGSGSGVGQKETYERVVGRLTELQSKFGSELIDFSVNSSSNMDTLESQLKKIADKLDAMVERMPKKLALQSLSPKLALVEFEPPSIWSGSCDDLKKPR